MNFTTAMQPQPQLVRAATMAANLRLMIRGRVDNQLPTNPQLANEEIKQAARSYRHQWNRYNRQRHNSQRNRQWLKKLDQHQLTQHTKQ